LLTFITASEQAKDVELIGCLVPTANSRACRAQIGANPPTHTVCFGFVQNSGYSSYEFSKVVADIIAQTNAASRSPFLFIKSAML